MITSQELEKNSDPILNEGNGAINSPDEPSSSSEHEITADKPVQITDIDALLSAASFENHTSVPETAPQIQKNEATVVPPAPKIGPISVDRSVRILNEFPPIDLKEREAKSLQEKRGADMVAEMIKNGDDGIIRATPPAEKKTASTQPVIETGTVHHVLPVFSSPTNEVKKVSARVSDQETADMETFLSSMKKPVETGGAPVVSTAPEATIAPAKKSEEHMGQTGGEWGTKDSNEMQAEPDATLIPGLEGALPSTEKKPSVPPSIPEWYVKKQLEEKEQRETAAALAKENADLKKQIAELTNNHAGEIGKLADRIKGLEAQASREAGLEDIIRGFEKKIAELMESKKEGDKAGEKKAKKETTENKDGADVIIATEEDIVPEDREKTPQDIASLYKRYHFGSRKERKELRLTESVIGIGANKYFEEVYKEIINDIHERNRLYQELENEKHSLLKRTMTLGLSGTYRRSAHDEGVNKIKPRIAFLTARIQQQLKTLSEVEKDTRKSPQVVGYKERKKQVKRLKGIAA